MIKKLITISVFLSLAMTLGLVGTADAAWNDVYFTADTTIGFSDLEVKSGSRIQQMIVGTANVTVTLASGSTATFFSDDGNIMVLDHPSAGVNVCDGSGDATLVVSYDPNHPTVILSLAGGTCSGTGLPTISTVVVSSTTTVTVTMSEMIKYVAAGTGEAGLIDASAGAAFVGATATARPNAVTAINGSSDSFTFTFPAGVLASAGIKDNSAFTLPDSILEDTGNHGLAASTSSVVTTLSSINMLYDFVFAIQTGDNFMSVPYNVKGPDGVAVSNNTKVGLTYVLPNGAIQITTILDSGSVGGLFSTPTSGFDPLYGYYINSTATTSPVYLRLNEDTTSLLPFERTIAAAGWHLIGVASNSDVARSFNAAANLGDAAILSTLTTPSSETLYSMVVDVAIGLSGDQNDGTPSSGSVYDSTYDTANSVYKALLDNDWIETKSKAEIDLANTGIEFNHGEAYFIYITGANAKYIGSRPNDTNIKL